MSRLVIVMMVLGAAAFAGLSAWGLLLYTGHDRLELIDRQRVVGRAEAACAALAKDVHAMQPSGPQDPVERAELVRSENRSVVAFVSAVRALGHDTLEDDEPAEAWLADWERLVAAREAFARHPDASDATAPAIPTDDGKPITRRMNRVGLRCSVPKELLDDFRRSP